MANEAFSVLSSTDDGGTTVVAQLDLSELESSLAPAISDPPAGFDPAHASRPEPAKPTVGPHRYTIIVPYDDEAMLNIGQGAAHRIPETGITAHTNTHMHFYVQKTGSACLSLGGGTTEAGYFVNQLTKGFAVSSTEEAAIWSIGQGSFVSGQAGIQISAEKEVSIDAHTDCIRLEAATNIGATAKRNINLIAGTKAEANADFWGLTMLGLELVGAGSKLVPKKLAEGAEYGKLVAGFTEGGKNGAKYVDFVLAKYGKAAHKVIGHVTTLVGLYGSYKKNVKAMEAGQSKWATRKDWGKFAIKAGQLIQKIIKDLKGESGPPDGSITMDAQGSVVVNAAKTVSLFGVSATMSAVKDATVSGLSAALKGVKDADVSGTLGASLKSSYGDVSVGSDTKGVKVAGKQKVDITSEEATVIVAAEQDVQLNSKSRQAYIHGKLGFYIGAGSGAGCGVYAAEEELFIGQIKQANSFPDAEIVPDKSHAHFKDGELKIAMGTKSVLELREKVLNIRSMTGTINMKSGKETYIKGKKVYLC